jgi:hypothetical protein
LNDAKGKYWESVIRVCAMGACSDARQLQAYHLNGKQAGMVSFRVSSTEAFGPYLVPTKPPRQSARQSSGADSGTTGTYYVSTNN